MSAPVPSVLVHLAGTPAPAPDGLIPGLIAVADSAALAEDGPLRAALIGRADVELDVALRLHRQTAGDTYAVDRALLLRPDLTTERALEVLSGTSKNVHMAVAEVTDRIEVAEALLLTPVVGTLARLVTNERLPLPIRVQALESLTGLPRWTRTLPSHQRWSGKDRDFATPARLLLHALAEPGRAHLPAKILTVAAELLGVLPDGAVAEQAAAGRLLLVHVDAVMAQRDPVPASAPQPVNIDPVRGCRQLLEALTAAPAAVRVTLGQELAARNLTSRDHASSFGLDGGAQLRRTAAATRWHHLTVADLRSPDILEALGTTLSEAFGQNTDAWILLASLGPQLTGTLPQVSATIQALCATPAAAPFTPTVTTPTPTTTPTTV